jgi:Na+/H+ antiporter NhaC
MILYALPIGGKRLMSMPESTDVVLKGSMGLVPVTLLVVLAFAIGQVSRALEMGPYLVSIIGSSGATWWMPALVFLVAGFVSFTLGSSWTTFAIVLPVVLPLAEGLGIPAPLMLGAVLSGGVFGDHASPLSDTTIISSMAAACDHVDHVNTQLPYTLGLAALTTAMFLVAGAVAS